MRCNSEDRSNDFSEIAPKPLIRTAVRSLLAMVCALAGCSDGQRGGDAGTRPFPVAVFPGELDLGRVWAPCDMQHTLHLTNTSRREVTIEELKAGCACVSIAPSSLTISPGDSRSVTLTLHFPDSLSTDDTAQLEQTFRTSLVAIVRGFPMSPPEWELTGVVEDVLTVSPRLVSFEDTLIPGALFSYQGGAHRSFVSARLARSP